MEWIDEQLQYWQKKAFDNEKYPDDLSTVDMIRPYVEMNILLNIKIQILMNNK